MGCCHLFSTKSHYDLTIEKCVKELNKITNGSYFYDRSRIKMKFILFNKTKIQVDIVILIIVMLL